MKFGCHGEKLYADLIKRSTLRQTGAADRLTLRAAAPSLPKFIPFMASTAFSLLLRNYRVMVPAGGNASLYAEQPGHPDEVTPPSLALSWDNFYQRCSRALMWTSPAKRPDLTT
jgi:hypothetical protein